MKDKQKLWDKKLAEFKKTTDAIGAEIEDGIIDTVVVLNLLGVRTEQSCEGHLDRGVAAPWVMVAAPDEPKRRINQDKISAEIARKYGLKNLKMPKGEEDKEPSKLLRDAWQEENAVLEQTPETEEFKQWRQKNLELRDKVEHLFEEFYQGSDVAPGIRLELEGGGDFLRIHNGGEDFEKSKFGEQDDLDKNGLDKRLDAYRAEMRRFTEFLKNRYFREDDNGI